MSEVTFELTQEELPLSLLLEADPSEAAIASYMASAQRFVAKRGDSIVAVCIVKPLSNQICEICNIAVIAELQKKGLGTRLLTFVLAQLKAQQYLRVELGTGTFGYQLTYYQRMGFRVESVEKDYFLKHYNQPLFEHGIQHKDRLKLYLSL
ncbi:hypothetical protein N474_18295 [Pseudoalteromonas luteoviolacea CPMOR-2]|uniref:N-acetyltransferase domain-containing protein n=1 Tax=Pseudoalteromonas luteoviolacea DSM 6061 TaxID=1365250 RepID=A0A166W567_9GAMM|nr:GNAT family N-acetyltransferase [Pseudoalteromonas luteoviolacea]KZN35736.1 hypothetical protein N475_18025 [Pseudoalteromonas luteoviolacea DSM 6061]KZN54301.1 hypothetical protein N474_18295 [Pseudoalteromonas luteoviolacea CPMOR-2]MBE0389207.1 hypothetical protein [Pseudoalteromonas luteoviolacea DSM 6061]